MAASTFSPELLFPGLKKIFGDSYNERPMTYTQYFDILSSNRANEDYLELTGFGLVPKKAKGEDSAFDDPIQGTKTTLSNLNFSLGFKVTREDHDDDLYNKIKNMPRQLAFSVQQTVETEAALVFDNGFNAAFPGGDGVELFSTAHPLPGGGTFQNTPTIAADLNTTSFEQMMIDISAFPDGRNLTIEIKPKTLIVTETFRRKAGEILQSSGNPESANRNINTFQNATGMVVNQYLADADAWFVRTDVDGLICQKRIWPAEFRKDNNFDSDEAKFKTYFRLIFGWYDPRAVYGNPGA